MDPKDPNFIQDSSPDSTGYRLLSRETITILDQLRRTLQIIVGSLMLGVIVFGGYAIINGDGPRTFFGPDRMDVMLGLAVICAISSLVVPLVVGRAQQGGTGTLQPAMQSLLTGDQDQDRAIAEAQRIQFGTIVGCAFLEGGAFANLVALMTSNDDVHTLAALLLLLGIMWRFPWRTTYLRRIEFAVEEARLEQPLSK